MGAVQLETETAGPLPSGQEASREASRRPWLTSAVSMWVVVVAFGVVTLLWSAHVGVGLRDPGGRLFRNKVAAAILLFLVLAVVDVLVRTVRAGWSVAELSAQFATRWDVRRLALLLAGIVAYHAVYLSYRNMKSWDAFNTPRDHGLESFDRWLFLGQSPAVRLHELIGQSHEVTMVLAHVYEIFANIVSLSIVLAPAFITRTRRGLVTLTAGMWAWILGTISYYAIPSLGPAFTAPQDFAGLPHTFITDHVGTYLEQRQAFLANPADPTTFVSISAFASLHVGLTCMLLLLARYYGKRVLTAVLAVYLVLVMAATIYFGWHFFSDVVAGVVLAVLAVTLGHLTVYPRSLLAVRRGRVRASQ
ncbi:phosphatase PAP2 family protein [Nocardioides sp. DS6]|uniref:Phosphatase PAP2 family protein n=1 Tax=Nocardioides eburneus TaxID=3231482 RepID=A0ABV3SWB7_9ACTN